MECGFGAPVHTAFGSGCALRALTTSVRSGQHVLPERLLTSITAWVAESLSHARAWRACNRDKSSCETITD